MPLINWGLCPISLTENIMEDINNFNFLFNKKNCDDTISSFMKYLWIC